MIKKQLNLDFDNCPPNAGSMIHSMRAFGYEPGMAIADIIDNSISAGAKNIWIIQNWAGEDTYTSILDDGSGMDEKTLIEAMRLGTHNPLDKRSAKDLGRFGFGLKTASFSQCSLLTVRTKTKEKQISTRCWNLDYINEIKDWHLLKSIDRETEHLLKPLETVDSGTIVLWQNMDRITKCEDVEDEQAKNEFLRKIEEVQKYLEMVFHRYITSTGKINIYLCNPTDFGEPFTKLKPWDPFLTTHSATQELSNEALELFGDKIRVRPFVLPHISKLTPSEHSNASGEKGWNAHQGFYIYRKERLIVAGGWLDIGYKNEDHYKLARIQVDIPNNMDEEWKIDVKKSRASPPDSLRQAFKRIAKLTREKAANVYRYRGKVELRKHDSINRFVWKKVDNRGSISYRVDRHHPLIKELIDKNSNAVKDIHILLKLIEKTVPIEQIIITNSENPDAHIKRNSSDNPYDMPLNKWFLDLIEIYLNKGFSKQEAINTVMSIEPFNQHPELIALTEESV